MAQSLTGIVDKISQTHDVDLSTTKQQLETTITSNTSNLQSLTTQVTNLDNSAVKLTGNQTISGTKTFSAIKSTNQQVFDFLSTTLAAGAVKPLIRVSYKDATQGDGISHNNCNVISVIGSSVTADANNCTVLLGSNNGTTIIGAGESSQKLPGVLSLFNDENVYVVADAGFVVYTGCSNDGATSKKAIATDTNGNVTILGNVIPNNGSGATVKQTYKSGTTWYRVWSDGFIEQGGTVAISEWQIPTITLPKAFTNTNYTICVSGISYSGSYHAIGCLQAKTTTTFKHYFYNNQGINPSWYACGY